MVCVGFMCEGDQQLRRIGVDRQKRKKNVLNTLEYSSLFLFGFVDVLKILKWSFPGFIHSISLPNHASIRFGSPPYFSIDCDGQFPLSLVPSPCEFRGFVDEDNSRLCAPQFEMEPAKNKRLW